MGPRTARLIGLLDQAAARMHELGDSVHALRIEECREFLQRSDYRGIERTLSVFNARGSLNDVERPPLGDLSREIWAQADSIRRDVERDSRRDD